MPLADLQKLCSSQDSEGENLTGTASEKQTGLQVLLPLSQRALPALTLLLRRATMAGQRRLHLGGGQILSGQSASYTHLVASGLGKEGLKLIC